MLKKILLLSLLLATICWSPAMADTQFIGRSPVAKPKLKAPSQDIPGQFDFYVLSLSWSPNYCATNGSQDKQQCAGNRRLGFVLHGLWPQFDRGWPSNCTREALNPNIQRQFPDLYPNSNLYSHEWSKHGTCSGLSQQKYHQLAADLKAEVKIPPRYNKPKRPFRTTLIELKQEFISTNPNLSVDRIAPMCSGSGRFLQEVTICEPKTGNGGKCSAEILNNSNKSCAQPDFLVRNVR